MKCFAAVADTFDRCPNRAHPDAEPRCLPCAIDRATFEAELTALDTHATEKV